MFFFFMDNMDESRSSLAALQSRHHMKLICGNIIYVLGSAVVIQMKTGG